MVLYKLLKFTLTFGKQINDAYCHMFYQMLKFLEKNIYIPDLIVTYKITVECGRNLSDY